MSAVEPTAPVPLETLLEHRHWVRALARRLARDPSSADDLEQQAWLKALSNPPSNVGTLRGWLAAVVRNCARDAYRRDVRRQAREQPAGSAPPTPATTADLVVRAEAHRVLIRETLALTPPYRDVVLLRYFEDLQPKEIAERTGVPAATVRTRLRRALQHLRGRLDSAYGERRAWMLAVTAGEAMRGPWTTGGGNATSTVGSAVAMSTKTKLLGVGIVLLFAVTGWMALPAGEDGAPAAAEDEPAEEASADTRRPRSKRPERAAAPPAEGPADVSEAESAPIVAEEEPRAVRRLDVVVLPDREPAKPPRMPTTVEIGDGTKVRVGGQGAVGGMRMVGWTKWKEPPEKGTCTFSGRVLDESGRALAGASVMRVEVADGRRDGSVVSYQWIKEIATTGDDGTFVATEQPCRPFRIAANYHRAMNRPRGLLLDGSVPVEPSEDQTVARLDVRLPVHASDFATVAGRLVDDEGRPVKRAQLFAGYQEGRSDKEGRFRFEGVRVGDVTFRVRKTGYSWVAEDRRIPVGGSSDVEIVVPLAESGSLELEGTVTDTEGVPIPDASIFLSGGLHSSRNTRTDAEGVFRFRRLPERFAKQAVDVMVLPHPDKPGFFRGIAKGVTVPSPGLKIEVERTAMLRMLVREAGTDTPIVQFNVDVKREVVEDAEVKRVGFRSATLYEEDGVYEIPVPKGRLILFLEAPGRRPLHVAVDVPDAGETSEVVLELRPE